MRTAQVTRAQLEAWVGQPFFEGQALEGVVVRMAYGGSAAAATQTAPGEQSYMVMTVSASAGTLQQHQQQ